MKGSVMVSAAGFRSRNCMYSLCCWTRLYDLRAHKDAMSEAVEGAAIMLYGVSEKYKER